MKSNMDKKQAIELTCRIYKQTLLFPKREPLRYKLREVADEILEGLIQIENNSSLIKKKDFIAEVIGKIEVLDAYLEIIKWQNWVSYFDIIKLKEEFDYLKSNLNVLADIQEKKQETSVKEVKIEKEEDDEIDERKKKIINILKEKERAQVGDIKKMLPKISKRTLRRDFDVLIKRGLVERIGESNNTFYKLN
jgi:DNA-binding transcriptional ArsR family regulator